MPAVECNCNENKPTAKLLGRIYAELPPRLKEVGIRFHVPEKIAIRHLKKLRKRIHERIKSEEIEIVSGKGKRKTPLQRLSETVDQWISKLKQYTNALHICGGRNSYSNHEARKHKKYRTDISHRENMSYDPEAALNLAFGIQSPSTRVKPVGENVSAGVGVGMTDYDFTTDAGSVATAVDDELEEDWETIPFSASGIDMDSLARCFDTAGLQRACS